MIHHSQGVESAPLIPGQPLVVGRSKPSDLRIPDRTLSRKHARFTLLDSLIFVEDLGSLNGTWVAGKRIDHSTAIELSGHAMLGTASAQVVALGRPAAPILLGEAAFHARLDEEVTRAQLTHRPFALLAVRADGAEAAGEPAASWVARLREVLRPIDRMSLYTDDTALVLLPEADLATGRQRARAVSTGASDKGAPRLVGVAVYPKSASSGENLLHRAVEALGRARPDEPVACAPTSERVESENGDEEEPIAGAALQRLLQKAQRVASSRIPVLLQGETGTGKEVLARFIHQHGRQQAKDMMCVNCAAIPATLLESTLFGHEKGAFTGATKRQISAFEEAHESTLFLDEIGELSAAAQAALLRVLETGRFSRVGSSKAVKVNVRFISATNRDLQKMVKEGTFREDLYHRLNTEVLEIPPLRERRDEIDRLSERFLRKANQKDGRAVRDIAPEAMALLRAYPWPGNVRELRNVIERAVAVAQGDQIQPDDLPARLQATPSEVKAAPGADQAPAAALPPARASEAAPGGGLKTLYQQVEKQAIEEAIREASGNLTKATKELGMSRSKLGRRMKALGIKRPKP